VLRNRLHALLVGVAVATGLVGYRKTTAETVDAAGRFTRPSHITLDDLQTGLAQLAATADTAAVRDGLLSVIAGLDAQASLVTSPFEATYAWLLVKLQALCSAVEEAGDEDDGDGAVVHTVNTLAAELADALAA
jgi:hypothetical protein